MIVYHSYRALSLAGTLSFVEVIGSKLRAFMLFFPQVGFSPYGELTFRYNDVLM